MCTNIKSICKKFKKKSKIKLKVICLALKIKSLNKLNSLIIF